MNMSFTKRATLRIEIPESCSSREERTPVNLRMTEITQSLYISSYKCAKNLEFLRSHGITHILNLSSSENVFAEEFICCSVGLPEKPKDDIYELISDAINFIDESIQNGGKVLIHCFRGKSRAPTIACAYLMKKSHLSTRKALKMVKEKQPHSNPGFILLSQLSTLENKFKI